MSNISYAAIIAIGTCFFSFRFRYFNKNSIAHARMQRIMHTLCECIQTGNDPVQSRIAPINGPKKRTNIPFPTICHPNAAGNFSSDEYSLTVRVKLLSAIPRKKPAMHSQTIMFENSVCSAKTVVENEEKLELILIKMVFKN